MNVTGLVHRDRFFDVTRRWLTGVPAPEDPEFLLPSIALHRLYADLPLYE